MWKYRKEEQPKEQGKEAENGQREWRGHKKCEERKASEKKWAQRIAGLRKGKNSCWEQEEKLREGVSLGD